MKFSSTIAMLALGASSLVGAAPVPDAAAAAEVKREPEADASAEYKKVVGKRQFYPVYGPRNGYGPTDAGSKEKREAQFYPVYGPRNGYGPTDAGSKEKREAQFYPVYGVSADE